MKKHKVRAYAIRWLTSKVGSPRKYRGLDRRRAHFECGCSIVFPSLKVRRHIKPHRRQPGAGWTSTICADHRRALGHGDDL